MPRQAEHHSPAHRWGQIIGEVLENAVKPLLAGFAQRSSLYLDSKGSRPARKTVDVVWEDSYGNRHKLDYVLERGGSPDHIGAPCAFVETAWRRYTKHSKNKAQEIEAAIRPLLSKHSEAAPFFGVILAGEFTGAALNQLRSVGCTVLYLPYSTVLAAFHEMNIDASTEEDTARELLERKVREWERLTPAQRQTIASKLLALNEAQVTAFMDELTIVATRRLDSVQVLPLHGTLMSFPTIEAGVAFLEQHTPNPGAQPFVKYELVVRYNTGSRINAEFVDKVSALQFLRGYQSPEIHPVGSEAPRAATEPLSVAETAFEDDNDS